MESRSFRIGSDGLIHSALRDQLAANPMHTLSYAQNVGYALPGFKPTVASAESVGQDSILKGWQYLSASGVSSLNVPSAAGAPAAAFTTSTTAFPGLNHRASSTPSTATHSAAAAAAAVASAAALRPQRDHRAAFSAEIAGRAPSAPFADSAGESYPRSTATQFRLSLDSSSQPPQAAAAASSRATSSVLRAAVVAPPPSKPWADFVPGGDVGAAAAAAATSQLQHTLAASHHSNIRRASDFVAGSRIGESSDRASQLALRLQMMDDLDGPPASLPPQFQQPNAASREMLLEWDGRRPWEQPVDGGSSAAASAYASVGAFDVPVETPRSLAAIGPAPPPLHSAAASAISDGNNTDALSESDVSSLPSGSNSARLSGSGRDSAVDGLLKEEAAASALTLDPPDLLSSLSASTSHAAALSSGLSDSSASFGLSSSAAWDVRRRPSNSLASSSASVGSVASNTSNSSISSGVSSVTRQALLRDSSLDDEQVRKFLKRGAASFVAQLRPVVVPGSDVSQEDQLVSIIMTVDMMVIAAKPSYQPLFNLKINGDISAYPVPRDDCALILIIPNQSQPLVFGCGQPQLIIKTISAFVERATQGKAGAESGGGGGDGGGGGIAGGTTPNSGSAADNSSDAASAPSNSSAPPPPPPPPPPPSAANPVVDLKAPLDLLKQIKKADGADPPTHGAAPSAPPPPPPPNLIAAPALPPRKPSVLPRAPMRPLHWQKIPDALVRTSIWKDLNDSCVPLDAAQLELLFGAKQQSEAVTTQDVKGKQTLRFLTAKKAHVVGVMMSQIKISVEQLCDAIRTMSIMALDCISSALLADIIRAIPSDKEQDALVKFQAQLKDGSASEAELAPPEAFVFSIFCIPRVKERLQCLVFVSEFPARIQDASASLSVFSLACKELQSSSKLAKLFEIILAIGNFVNFGSARGGAYGFKVAHLSKLKEFRSNDKQMHLMGFIVAFTQRRFPVLIDFHADLKNLEIGSHVSQTLFEDVAKIAKDVEFVAAELANPLHKTSTADQFVRFMTSVYNKASEEMKELQESVASALLGFKSLQAYLAEPSMQPAELLSHLHEFVSSFKETVRISDEARKELQRQAAEKMHLESRRRRPTRRASVAGPGDNMLRRGATSLAAVPETVEIIDVDVPESVHPFKPAAFHASNGLGSSTSLSLQLPPLPASPYALPPPLTMQQSALEISEVIAESAGSKKVTKDALLRGHLGGRARRNTTAGT